MTLPTFFITYLLPVSVALALFYAFYKCFLAEEPTLRLNRLVLIFSVLFALVLPFISIPLHHAKRIETMFVYNAVPWGEIYAENPVEKDAIPWFLYIYCGLASLLFLRLMLSLVQLLLVIRYNQKEQQNGLIIVRNTYAKPSFFIPFPKDSCSFFNYVFLADKTYPDEDIQMILAHEKQHYIQIHTLDVILLECLVIVQFFNPFAWLLRHEVRMNHEYLADQGALRQFESKPLYLSLLLKESLKNPSLLTHPFSRSPTKKRILMQTRTNHSLYGTLKSLLMLPLIASLLFFFGSKQAEAKLNFDTGKQIALVHEDDPIDEPQVPEEIFETVDEQPVFPGGEAAYMAFLKEHINYPEDAKKANIQGTVYASFVIRKDGSLVDAKILRGLSPSIDAETLRVISIMPKWTPGKKGGKVVNVRFNMPVRFTIVLPTETEWEEAAKSRAK